MNRTLLRLVVVAGIAGGASPVFAHGGQYRGPDKEVPPDSRKPEDPPPPDSGGNTPTPPDSGGSTPTPPDSGGSTPTPPDGGTPTPPDKGTPPGTGVSPPTTGNGPKTKSPARKGLSYDSWMFWWGYNRDEFVNVRARMRRGASASGGAGISIVIPAPAGAGGEDVTDRRIRETVIPVLARAARDASLHPDIQSAAILALAKAGAVQEIPMMMSAARSRGPGRPDRVVEESAALALGLMQEPTPEVLRCLAEVAADETARTRTRAFAAVALGLLGGAEGENAEALDVLRRLVTRKSTGRDVPCGALVGMGLLGDRAALPDLLRWLAEEKAGEVDLDDLALSYVAGALGKIGRTGLSGPASREVVDSLVSQLKRRNAATRRSAAIALGQVAPQGDESVQAHCARALALLSRSEEKGTPDPQAVGFALVSLGRIAGAAGCPAAVRERALEALAHAFDKGSAGARNFAALGLGLAGSRMDGAERAPIQDTVRYALARSHGDAEARGALVIAAGLLGDIRSAPLLRSILEEAGDARLRGHAAVALGLMQDPGARDLVRGIVAGEKEERDLRVQAAVGAGLLGDRGAVPALVALLGDRHSAQFTLGTVAIALGQIGDERAVGPLVKILEERETEVPVLTRALAAVALGQIADRRDLPVLSRVSKDVNYRAYVDAIGEILTIL